jgi:hypothetical protein
MSDDFLEIMTWPFSEFFMDNEEEAEPAPADTGAVDTIDSVEQQSTSRRLARLSKYFTSPSGVLDSPTGSTGVF